VIRARGIRASVEKEREMVATERKLLRKKLDKEMRLYRLAGREKNPTSGLLRAVRQALKIPIKEMMERMGIGETAVFDLEEREETGAITLRSLGRMAEAMGCKVVYGIIPANGKTLESMDEERLWKSVLGSGEKKSEGPREQGAEAANDEAA
jgi:transcriptional regulator with XRE-family HTH domain